METCSWFWIGVFVGSVDGFVTFVLVDIVSIVPDVHAVHPRGDAVHSLHNVVWIFSLFLQFFMSVFS